MEHLYQKYRFFFFFCIEVLKVKYSTVFFNSLLLFNIVSLVEILCLFMRTTTSSLYEFWAFLTCPQSKQLQLHAWGSEIIVSVLKITSAVCRNAGLFER